MQRPRAALRLLEGSGIRLRAVRHHRSGKPNSRFRSWQLYHAKRLSLLDLDYQNTTVNPARLLNLPKGHAGRRSDADVTIFDPDPANGFLDRCRNREQSANSPSSAGNSRAGGGHHRRRQKGLEEQAEVVAA